MADEMYARVGAAIRSRRQHVGLTQEDLASRTGLKRSSVTNIERGGQAILLHQLVDLSRALSADPCEFLAVIDIATSELQSQPTSRAAELLARLGRRPGTKPE